MKNTNNGGISFLGLLTIVFIVLKLTHYINWSWWLVLGPLWIPVAFVVLAIATVWIAATVIKFFSEYVRK